MSCLAFFTTHTPHNAIDGKYNLFLVALSYAIATLTSFVALEIAGYLRKGGIKAFWLALLGGAFAMGAGIFTMHFVGMLAFIMPMSMGFNSSLTLLSLAVAISASALALFIVSIQELTWKRMILGGTIIGFAIAGMHYIGMEAMLSVSISYRPLYFTLSIFIAITASIAALWLMVQCDRGSAMRRMVLKIISALIMGFAICGMHYMGMAAAVIVPAPEIIPSLSFFALSPERLSFLIAFLAALILFVGLYLIGRQFSLLLKLLFGFLIIVFMLVPIAFASLENIKAVTNSFEVIAHVEFPKIMALMNMKTVVGRLTGRIDHFHVHISDTAWIAENMILSRELEQLQKYEQDYLDAEESSTHLATQLHELKNAINELTHQLLNFKDKNVNQAELTQTQQQLFEAGNNLNTFIEKQISLEKANLNRELSNINILKKQSIFVIISLVVFIFALSLFLSLFISISIANSIIKLRDASNEIARGELTKRVEVESKDEIGQLASSFNSMAAALEASHKKRDEFVSMAAHDLRIPVSVINEGSRLLSTEALGPLNQKQLKLSEMISTASISMIGLLDELLAANTVKTKSTQINRKKINLIEFLENIYTFNQIMAEKKHIDLKLSLHTKEKIAFFDEGKISQVINNFVSNAVKFSPFNTSVNMVIKKMGDMLRVEVHDQAGGIPEDEQKKVFTWFSKISVKPTAGEASHGLGLAICKDIIQAHGGDIGFKSDYGKGSIFFFEIQAFERKSS